MQDSQLTIPDGYKQTEVGIIPNDWRCESLKGKIEIIHGFAFLGRHFKSQGLYRLTTPGHFYENGGFRDIGDKQRYYDGTFPDSYLLRPNDLIVAMTEQADGLLGSAAFIPEFGNYLHNQRLGRVRLISSEVERRYLYYIFNSKNFRSKVRLSAAGTKVKHTSPNKLLRINVPFPPLPEQQAIAEVLSDVDALITSVDRLIAKKRNIKQGAMQLLLTGKKRLAGFSGDWETKRLGEIGEVSGAGVDKKIRPNEIPVRLVNYMDVYKRDFIFSKHLNHQVTAPPAKASRCSVKQGDVFFTPSSEVRDDIGLSAVAMEDISDAVYSYHVVRLRLKEDWDLTFRTYIFKTRYFLNQAEMNCDGSGTRYVISLKKFRELSVSYPKLIEEQKAIARILSDMDAEIEALEKRREKYKAIKQGMMQELLTGKTRLVNKS